MKIISAWNPVWVNAEHTAIDLMVNFEELPENEVAFRATPNDVEEHGVELFENAVLGNYGTIAPYVVPPVVVTVPVEISTRQFLIAAAVAGIITEAEAVAAATTGAVPAGIEAVFSTLPSEQQFAARITWAKMTIIPRNDALVAAVGAALSMTSQQMDQFFIAAGNIP